MPAGIERRVAGRTNPEGMRYARLPSRAGGVRTTALPVHCRRLHKHARSMPDTGSFITRNRLRQVRDGMSGCCALHGELPDWKHESRLFPHLHSPSTCTNIS